MEAPETSLDRARKAVPGGKIAELAELLGIEPAAIYQWNGTVPPKRAIQIEEKTGGKITRHEIRPDYFGEPAKPRAAA